MILLITPAFTSLNSPYPATTVLTAFLRDNGYHAHQMDLGIELLDRIFSRKFLERLFSQAFQCDDLSRGAQSIMAQRDAYLLTVDPVMAFLRGHQDTLGVRIISGAFLPEGPRFRASQDDQLDWAFGVAGVVDRAKHLCTLYLEDLTDLIAEVVDPGFSLVKYGEQLALAASTFDELEQQSLRPNNVIDDLADELLEARLEELVSNTLLSSSMAENEFFVGFTVPFPGCMLSALRCARYMRERSAVCQRVGVPRIILGGGYVSTELRQISDPRIFNYIDYLVFDDGEVPLLRIVGGQMELLRTVTRMPSGEVTPLVDSADNARFTDLPTPCFEGLPLEKYFSTITLTNPMHKLWSDGMWNKMTVAHGCYWAGCTFCDTSLDYICRYEAPSAKVVVDRMEAVMRQTSSSGFHFTDEALPPKLLREVAREIIDRGLIVSFWGNIRFERTFDAELCALLARAGCVAVSGGVEVASPRILKLINKGITLDGLRGTLEAFADSGIMVHAYLMYGFPSQTLRETVASLEVVRGFFADGLVQSAFWHRFAMTIHSATGREPERFGAVLSSGGMVNSFANNAVEYIDTSAGVPDSGHQIVDWDAVGSALTKATYNYMHFTGLDVDVNIWFK